MPNATLLREPWETRTMVFGNRRLVFKGQTPQKVSVAVALVLSKRKDEYGKVLFRVTEMPSIVALKVPVVAPVQNETRAPKQRKLA